MVQNTWFSVRTKIEKSIIYVLLVLLLVICLMPFYFMIINATRSAAQIQLGFSLLPGKSFSANFALLETYVKVWRGMANSAVIATSATLLTAYFSSLTAFGFQFYEFKGKNIFFVMMLAMMMVPGQLGLIGFYRVALTLKMLDTYIPLIVPAIANAFGVFFIRQYMAGSLHPSLIEAARIDGSSEVAIFHKIALPLSAPAIATQAIMAFIGNWNNFITPRVIIISLDKRPLPVMIGALRGSIVAQSNFGATYAAVAVSVIPVMIVFVFASKYIINGISAGGVKG